ncbi:hypothetical protein DFH06DRAFT_1121810 [Mycena polygramma]|nr:hypothetical protein DFH06DRAFT_1121810 [Mycena polygramma]
MSAFRSSLRLCTTEGTQGAGGCLVMEETPHADVHTVKSERENGAGYAGGTRFGIAPAAAVEDECRGVDRVGLARTRYGSMANERAGRRKGGGTHRLRSKEEDSVIEDGARRHGEWIQRHWVDPWQSSVNPVKASGIRYLHGGVVAYLGSPALVVLQSGQQRVKTKGKTIGGEYQSGAAAVGRGLHSGIVGMDRPAGVAIRQGVRWTSHDEGANQRANGKCQGWENSAMIKTQPSNVKHRCDDPGVQPPINHDRHDTAARAP